MDILSDHIDKSPEPVKSESQQDEISALSDAEKGGHVPLAKILGHVTFSQEPRWFTTAPISAIHTLLEKIDWKPDDSDLYEINEAFAVVTIFSQVSDGDGFYNAAISKEEESLFFDFFNNPVTKQSLIFFNPEGLLSYDPFTKEYLIETKEKRDQDVYNGNSLLYNPVQNTVAFEGGVNLMNNDNNFKIFSSMSGKATIDSMNIESDAFMIIDINLKKSIEDELGFAFNDIIETYGAPIAHDNEQDILVRLSDLIGNDKIITYENMILSEYKSLIEADAIINSTFVFPNTKFTWSPSESSWYNTSSVNLSNIGSRDVNASIDGFIEIKNIDEYNSLVNLFLQPAPELWVFLSYDGKKLTTLSSNERYNSEMSEITSTRDKFVSIRIADENNVLDYINDFRLKYFGIKEPYDLMSPSDTFLEDEIFKTVSDDDDGF